VLIDTFPAEQEKAVALFPDEFKGIGKLVSTE
jgi:hypothetical protein